MAIASKKLATGLQACRSNSISKSIVLHCTMLFIFPPVYPRVIN